MHCQLPPPCSPSRRSSACRCSHRQNPSRLLPLATSSPSLLAVRRPSATLAAPTAPRKRAADLPVCAAAPAPLAATTLDHDFPKIAKPRLKIRDAVNVEKQP